MSQQAAAKMCKLYSNDAPPFMLRAREVFQRRIRDNLDLPWLALRSHDAARGRRHPSQRQKTSSHESPESKAIALACRKGHRKLHGLYSPPPLHQSHAQRPPRR